MYITFVSNYINHHQIPFCKAMCAKEGVKFTFVQTQPMEAERVKMGWTVKDALSFVKYYYKEPEKCAELILKSDVVIFGGTDDESYIKPRLKAGKPVIRCSERLYREAQWKAVSPRGLVKKYLDHTRYRKEKVYLLCAGGYVPDDFHIVRAYPGKMYRWGYFPETRRYDIAALMSGKGYKGNGALTEGKKRPLYLLWVGRFMTLKHPELAIHAAGYLKGLGISFHLDMVGGGAMEEVLKKMIREKGLEKEVTLTGYKKPEEVRERMEKADILLATSDRGEGWGAVINEAMNSGCVVIADHMMGAVPFLIRHRENGLIYEDGNYLQMCRLTAEMAENQQARRRLGVNAYKTITQEWNAENAAEKLVELIHSLGLVEEKATASAQGEKAVKSDKYTGPCSPAPVIRERKMYQWLCGREAKSTGCGKC